MYFPTGALVALQGLGRSERRWRPPLQVLLYNLEAMNLGLKGAHDLESLQPFNVPFFLISSSERFLMNRDLL